MSITVDIDKLIQDKLYLKEVCNNILVGYYNGLDYVLFEYQENVYFRTIYNCWKMVKSFIGEKYFD